jgi:hypothetical protein
VTGYVLAFGLALLLAVLTSGLASRSPLSTITVLVSAAAHSSTDLFVAQRLSAEQLRLDPDSPARDVESVER